MRQDTVQRQGPTKSDGCGSTMGGGQEVHRFLPTLPRYRSYRSTDQHSGLYLIKAGAILFFFILLRWRMVMFLQTVYLPSSVGVLGLELQDMSNLTPRFDSNREQQKQQQHQQHVQGKSKMRHRV